MNDIILNWKKIARGLPRAGKAANDRAPTAEEIQKLVGYPDRRIKPIVCFNRFYSSQLKLAMNGHLNFFIQRAH
jgi:hypothetical protein